MHSGINSGVVITSDLDGDRASGPLGDMVNVASRLQSLARSGEILIGPETAVAGAGPVRAHRSGRARVEGSARARPCPRVDALASPNAARRRADASAFIGRHEEIGVLVGAVDRLRDGESSLITVCAEAGAGKTRLLEEVRSRLDPDVQWLEGRAYPYTDEHPVCPA